MTQTHEQIVKSIKGSFAVEGISVSEHSLYNMERLSSGNISCEELISEIVKKYTAKRNEYVFKI